ncbi:MAG: hypothetical protein ABI277_14030 [Burkholderiaceae bacterium]
MSVARQRSYAMGHSDAASALIATACESTMYFGPSLLENWSGDTPPTGSAGAAAQPDRFNSAYECRRSGRLTQ